MTRACLLLSLLVATTVAVHAEDAIPFTGEVRLDTAQTVFEDKTALQPVGETLRVAAYNVENFTDGINDGPDQSEALSHAHAQLVAANVNEIDPAIILFIEIENGAALQNINQALKKPFPAGYITRLGDGTPDEQKLNLAVLSRVPLAEVKELDFATLQGPGRPPRGVLRIQVDLGDQHRLAAYLVHLKSNFGYKPRNMYQRRHGMQLVTRDAKQLTQAQPGVKWELLVLGDVNVDPDVQEFARDWSLSPMRGWKDLWRGKPIEERTTLPTRHGDPALEFPPACFDRIFVSGDLTNAPWSASAPKVIQKGVNTDNVKALPGQDGHTSDHFPIYLDVQR